MNYPLMTGYSNVIVTKLINQAIAIFQRYILFPILTISFNCMDSIACRHLDVEYTGN